MLDLLVTYWMSLTGAADIRLDGNIDVALKRIISQPYEVICFEIISLAG